MELEGADSMEIEEGATGGGGGSSSSDADEDRLSALPDSLLHAIMSFLKGRQAVQTCVLGTRWRHLWRTVPCLDIDHGEFRVVPEPPSNSNPAADIDSDDDEDRHSNSDENKDSEWDNFEDFADRLMHHRDIAMLDSLRLRVIRERAPRFASKQAGGWLRRAMKYCTPEPFSRLFKGWRSIGSWRLKRLYLCNVALDGRFRDHVRYACPSLEDLELEDCSCMIEAITSNSLESLVLKNCRWRFIFQIISPTLKSLAIAGGTNRPDLVLRICAPAIAHLHLDVPLDFAKGFDVN